MIDEFQTSRRQNTGYGRVALIGCRFTSAADVYALLSGGFVREALLIGDGREKLLKELNDLQRFVPPPSTARVRCGEISETAGFDIAIIGVGSYADEGETRLHLIGRNSAEAIAAVEQLQAAGFDGVIVISTEPVDVIAQLAQERTGYNAAKLIGIGTYPPDSDFENLAGTEAVRPVAHWCTASPFGPQYFDNCEPGCPRFAGVMRARVFGGESVSPAARLQADSLATCITKICEAVLCNGREVLPISTIAAGEYGLSGVYMTLPAVVGRNGVEQIIQMPMDEGNLEALHKSADLHKQATVELAKYGQRINPATPAGGEQ